MDINITDINLDFVKEINHQEIINKYCEYSFNSFNEKIIILACILILYEIINFFVGFCKNKRLKDFFIMIDFYLNLSSRIFILFLFYIVVIKVYPSYIFIFDYLSYIFIIFLFILMYQQREKIIKFMNKFSKTL